MDVYAKAYALERKERDSLVHAWVGTYGISALTFSIDHCLNGRKAKTEYIEDLLMSKIENSNKPLSEEEIQQQRELFVAQLRTRKANFDLNHKSEQGE